MILKNFFVIEGIDGSGTTTQTKLCTEILNSFGYNCINTFEPTDSPIGKLIRKILASDYSVHSNTLAQLFVADRTEHIYGRTGVQENCMNGNIVISDRYFFSTLAYQSLSTNYNQLFDDNKNFPLPEKLFFLKIDPEKSLARVDQRKHKKEIFEKLEIQKKVANNYLNAIKQFEELGLNAVIIDGTLPIEKITEKIISNLDKKPKI
ncbi:MAG: dTMP kinase [Spirochaetales bacterium]|nr:dTMP kinase [Spirochaetales bacterium]